MQSRRVVLLSNHSLLASGVEKLLQSVDDLELTVVAADDPGANTKLRQLAPRAIVLDAGDASLGEGVITRMLEEHPTARVIALNLNRAVIEVYGMERLLSTDLDRLLEAIKGKGRITRGRAKERC